LFSNVFGVIWVLIIFLSFYGIRQLVVDTFFHPEVQSGYFL